MKEDAAKSVLFNEEEMKEYRVATADDVEKNTKFGKRDFEERIDTIIGSFFKNHEARTVQTENMEESDPFNIGETIDAKLEGFSLNDLFIVNNVNLAKWFHGKDGGYSEDRLKRMLYNTKKSYQANKQKDVEFLREIMRRDPKYADKDPKFAEDIIKEFKQMEQERKDTQVEAEGGEGGEAAAV
jgi:hypothetical protein